MNAPKIITMPHEPIAERRVDFGHACGRSGSKFNSFGTAIFGRIVGSSRRQWICWKTTVQLYDPSGPRVPELADQTAL